MHDELRAVRPPPRLRDARLPRLKAQLDAINQRSQGLRLHLRQEHLLIRKLPTTVLGLVLLSTTALPDAENPREAQDKQLEGRWEAVSFIRDGKDEPQTPGIILLTIRGKVAMAGFAGFVAGIGAILLYQRSVVALS